MVDAKAVLFIGDYIFCVEEATVKSNDSTFFEYSLVVKTLDLKTDVARTVFHQTSSDSCFIESKVSSRCGGLLLCMDYYERDSCFFCMVSGELKKKTIPYQPPQKFIDVSSDKYATWYSNTSVVVYDMDSSTTFKVIDGRFFSLLHQFEPVYSVLHVPSGDVYHLRRNGVKAIDFSLYRCRKSSESFERVFGVGNLAFVRDSYIRTCLFFISETIMVCKIGRCYLKIDISDPGKIDCKLAEIRHWTQDAYPEVCHGRFFVTGKGHIRDIVDMFSNTKTQSGCMIDSLTESPIRVPGYSMERHMYVAHCPSENRYLLVPEKSMSADSLVFHEDDNRLQLFASGKLVVNDGMTEVKKNNINTVKKFVFTESGLKFGKSEYAIKDVQEWTDAIEDFKKYKEIPSEMKEEKGNCCLVQELKRQRKKKPATEKFYLIQKNEITKKKQGAPALPRDVFLHIKDQLDKLTQ